MSYVGRVEAMVLLEDGDLEIISLNMKPKRGWYGDALIDDGGYYSKDGFKDMLAGKSDGFFEITGRYFEEFHQDYSGEWDGDYHLEGERIRYCGPAPVESVKLEEER